MRTNHTHVANKGEVLPERDCRSNDKLQSHGFRQRVVQLLLLPLPEVQG